MTVFIGAERVKASKGKPVKADLLAIASGMGIEVPKGSTNPQIAALIEAKRG